MWPGHVNENPLSSADSNTQYTAEIQPMIDTADYRCKPCYEDCFWLSVTVMPTMMIGLVALLFAAGTSAIVAFIPLQVSLFGLLLTFISVAIKENSGKDGFMTAGLVGVPLLSLLTF